MTSKSWRVRRERYGGKGHAEPKRWLSVREKVLTSMLRNKQARAVAKKLYVGKRRSIMLAKLRRIYRHRPNRLGYYMGDQVKPLSQSSAGMRQWKECVKRDKALDGSDYEKWERLRRNGRDVVTDEYAYAIGKKKLRKVV